MDVQQALQHKIDFKTKPLCALGQLEHLALQLGRIQNTTQPTLTQPHLVVFAASHGLAQEGVSAYPAEVTQQMVLNFLNGGAAINVFCKQHAIALKIVDAGVAADFEPNDQLIMAKAAYGTKNALHEPAMSVAELEYCLQQGKQVVKDIALTGCNIIGFGEMGIGNTSAASLVSAAILNVPVATLTGKGTGVNDEQLQHKINILQQVLMNRNLDHADAKTILQAVGGFEMAQMCGAMLEAYQQGMAIMIDGFIATAVVLVCQALQPNMVAHCIFCHNSDEQAHAFLLQHLQAQPILQLQLRVGEGTGCALAYPIIKSAVHFLNEMASFEDAKVSNKDE